LLPQIRWQGENIAAITFRSRNLDNYDSSHLNIAAEIANQVAGAIANQIALQKSLSVAKERELLARISSIATGSNDLHDAFEQITAAIKEFVPWDRIAVTALPSNDSAQYLFQSGVQFDKYSAGGWKNYAAEMIDLFSDDPTPMIIYQHSMSGSHEILRDQVLAEESGLKSWLLVPLIWRNNHIGHLHFRSLEPDAYNDYHIEISAQISTQIGGAIAAVSQTII